MNWTGAIRDCRGRDHIWVLSSDGNCQLMRMAMTHASTGGNEKILGSSQGTPACRDVKCFIPMLGSYYHFMNESALGLYNLLQENALLNARDCRLWYQGDFKEVVQLFSCHPVIVIPPSKPRLTDASSIGPGIQTLQHTRLEKKEHFFELLPMARFLSDRIPAVSARRGITMIVRTRTRVHVEAEELFARLRALKHPVRMVQMEKESFANQVNIMRNTLLLIAPHGAGTVNQMFMPEGGEIIELFPRGYENWHAGAMAAAFGHRLTEIQSQRPGIFGRQPSPEIRELIRQHGWPDRKMVQASRRHSEDLLRVVRDVSCFSIDPSRIMAVVENILARHPW